MQGCVLCHSTASVITDNRKARKSSSTPKFWENRQQSWEAKFPQCPWWEKSEKTSGTPLLWHQRVTAENLGLLDWTQKWKNPGFAASMACGMIWCSLPAVSLCLHCTGDSAVLIRWGQVCSPLFPHLCLQYRLRGLLPCFVTDLLSHFPSQHLCFLIFEMRITTSVRHFDVPRRSVLHSLYFIYYKIYNIIYYI